MIYDIGIVGLGPAGLSAAIYGARYNLRTLAVGAVLGGNMSEAWKVENYPGFSVIAGQELAERMKEQAEQLGAKIVSAQVGNLQKEKDPGGEEIFRITTANNQLYQSKSLVLALGTEHRRLNVPGEAQFQGKGVSYCALCDGMFFKDKEVAVVGGGDSATKTALLLKQYARKIYLIARGSELTGEPQNIAEIQKSGAKIEILLNSEVKEIVGDRRVSGIILKNGQQITVSGVFITIGLIPSAVLVKNLGIATNKQGYIETDERQRTGLMRVYAAGDITATLPGFKQILVAAAQGAIAAHSAYEDLKRP